MGEFRLYPPDIVAQAQRETVFRQLEAVQRNPQETLNILIQETQRLIKDINLQHLSTVRLYLQNHASGASDFFGYVLQATQLLVGGPGGFTKTDNFHPTTVMIELSELEVNDGNPVMSFSRYRDESGEIRNNGWPIKISITPQQVLLYLHGVANTGDTYPTIVN